jgi:ABC-type branched-subunit amino acid transport system substrate-binding protein
LAAVAPKAERDGVILIDTLDADEETAKLPGNTFCIAKTTESMGRKLAELILLKNDLPLALLYFDGDPFMGILAKALLAELALHDKSPLITETYNGQTSDFRDFATKVKSRGVRSVALLGYDTLGLAARNLRDIGSRAQFYGVNTATSPGFRELAGDSIKGMFGLAFIAPRNDELKKFEDEFKSRVGRVWRFETSTISSYDAMILVARALAEPGGLIKNESGAAVISTDRLRERLLSVKEYAGLSGTITIDPDGITRSLDVRAVEFGIDGAVRSL